MRKDLAPDQEEFNRMDKTEQIDALCSVHECNEKKRKIHFKQYVHGQWNPHPPSRFIQWWKSGGVQATEKKTNRGWESIDAIRAFNCEAVREVYRETKSIGAA